MEERKGEVVLFTEQDERDIVGPRIREKGKDILFKSSPWKLLQRRYYIELKGRGGGVAKSKRQ